MFNKYVLLHSNTSDTNKDIMANLNQADSFNFGTSVVCIDTPMNIIINRNFKMSKSPVRHHTYLRIIIKSSINQTLITEINFDASR